MVFFLAFHLASCQDKSGLKVNNSNPDTVSIINPKESGVSVEGWINPEGKNLKTRIFLPEGYERMQVVAGSFHEYLISYPLQKDGARVKYFDGSEKIGSNVYCAVFDQEIGNRDLHQCADAVMNLKASYHFDRREYDKIHFNFTSGHRADFKKYAEGYRASIKGSKVNWIKSANRDYSKKTFRKYMNLIYSYCGTASLSKELRKVELKDIKPGDIFILGGHPGHAVIVLDVAKNSEGEKTFLLAQSYMPAQQTQVLLNPLADDRSPWYFVKDLKNQLQTPEWDFELSQLMRFQD